MYRSAVKKWRKKFAFAPWVVTLANIRARARDGFKIRSRLQRAFRTSRRQRGKSARCAIGNGYEYLIYRRTRKRDERCTSCFKDFVSPFTWSSPRDVPWAPPAASMDGQVRSFCCFKEIYIPLSPTSIESEKKSSELPAWDIHPLPLVRLKKRKRFPRKSCVDLWVRRNFPNLSYLFLIYKIYFVTTIIIFFI